MNYIQKKFKETKYKYASKKWEDIQYNVCRDLNELCKFLSLSIVQIIIKEDPETILAWLKLQPREIQMDGLKFLYQFIPFFVQKHIPSYPKELDSLYELNIHLNEKWCFDNYPDRWFKEHVKEVGNILTGVPSQLNYIKYSKNDDGFIRVIHEYRDLTVVTLCQIYPERMVNLIPNAILDYNPEWYYSNLKSKDGNNLFDDFSWMFPEYLDFNTSLRIKYIISYQELADDIVLFLKYKYSNMKLSDYETVAKTIIDKVENYLLSNMEDYWKFVTSHPYFLNRLQKYRPEFYQQLIKDRLFKEK